MLGTMLPKIIFVVKFFNWMLLLINFMPISRVVTLNIVRFMQAKFIKCDVSMMSVSRKVTVNVNQPAFSDELVQVI